MAVAFVKNHTVASNKTSGTTLALTLDTAVPVGNLLVCRMVYDNAATANKPLVSSIGKAAGETNNWVLGGSVNSTSTSAGAFASGHLGFIRTSVEWPAGSYTVTLDTATVQKAGAFQEFSGALAVGFSVRGQVYSTTTTAASATTTGTTPTTGGMMLGFIFGSNVAAAQAGSNNTTGGSWSTPVGIGSTGGNAATNNFGVGQYKILTADGHQTLNNSAAMTAGNGALIAYVTPYVPPAITQAAYGFYNDDGTETGATTLAATDTAPTVDVTAGDVNLQLRTRLQTTNAVTGDAWDDFQLQWEKNASGTWTDVAFNYIDSNNAARTSNVQIAGLNWGIGQTFKGNGQPLTQAGFSCYTVSPGSVEYVAQIYAHSGTYGTSGIPTGPPLATSTPRLGSSFSQSSSFYTFDLFQFDGSFTPTNGTAYVLTVTIVTGATVAGNNFIVGRYSTDGTSHSGNAMNMNSSSVWSFDTNSDLLFRVVSGTGTVPPYDSRNLIDGAATTNRLGAGTGSFVAGKVSEDGLVDNLGWTANNYTELLYSLTLKQETLNPADTLRFRVLRNGVAYEAESLLSEFVTDTGSADLYVGDNSHIFQSFMGNGNALTKAEWYLLKLGTPTGNVTVELYAHTGTFGSGGMPTGSPLAVSTTILDAASLTTTKTWTSFTFTPFSLQVGVPYCLVVKFLGGNSTNKVSARLGTGGTGNGGFYYSGAWGTTSSDFAYRVYTAPTAITYTQTPTINVTKTIPEVTQAGYRFYDLGTETGSTPRAAQDTLTVGDLSNGDGEGQLRVLLQSTNTAPPLATDDWQLQFEKNASGTWTNVASGLIEYTTGISEGSASSTASGGGYGQSFQGDGKRLTGAEFKVNRGLTPTGTITAVLYAHSGTYGTSSVGTGSPLATSVARNISSLVETPTPRQWELFTFDGTFTLVEGTPYVILLRAGSTTEISPVLDAAGVAPGNRSYYSGSTWSSAAASDLLFKIRTTALTVAPYDDPSLTDGAATTNRLTGGTGSFSAGEISETGLVTDLGFTANGFTELVFPIQVKQSGFAAGDTIRFRVLRNGATTGLTYTQTPRIDITVTVPAVTQAAYRFYADGTETGSTALAAQDTAPSIDVTADVNLQLRERLQSTTTADLPVTDDWQLQWEKNTSGTWTNVALGERVSASYASSNADNFIGMYGATTINAHGQSFLGDGNRLTSATFWVSRLGAPTGNVWVELYAHTGTFGISSIPTGTALAVSNTMPSSSVVGIGSLPPAPETKVAFTFDGSFTLAAGTPYVIAVISNNTGTIGNTVGAAEDTTGTASGNHSFWVPGTSAWSADDTGDVCFEVLTAPAVLPTTVLAYDSANLTDAAATTNRLGAGTGTFVAGKIAEDGLVDNLGWTGTDFTEVLYSLTLKAADLAAADTLRFRVLRNGATTGLTYTQYPSIGVTKGTPPPSTSTLVATDGTDSFAGAPTATPPTHTSTLVATDGTDTFAAAPVATPPPMAGSATASHLWTPSAAGTAPPSGPLLVSDDFNRADGGLPPPWVTIIDTAAPSIVGNRASVGASLNDSAARYDLPFSNDQWAECDVVIPPSGGGGILSAAVRLGVNNALPVYYTWYASGNLQLWKRTSGPTYTQLGSNVAAGLTYKVRIEVEGTTVRMYKDGTLVVSVTDTAATTGQPGLMGGNYGEQPYADNFRAGDLPYTPPAGPIPSTGLLGWWDATRDADFTYSTGNDPGDPGNKYVSQWNDRSGNNNHAVGSGNAGYHPHRTATISGLKAVNFAQAGSYIAVNKGIAVPTWLSAATKPVTYAAVVRFPTPLAPDSASIIGPTTSGLMLRCTSTGVLNLVVPGVADLGSSAAGVVVAGGTYLLTAGWDTATGAWWIRSNGVEVASGTSGVTPSGTAPVGLASGADYGADSLTGVLGEAIVYNRVLTGPETTQVENYLYNKWFIPTLSVTDGRDTLAATVTATPPTHTSTLVVTDGRDTFGAAPTTTPPTFSSTLVVTDGRDTIVTAVTATPPTHTSTLVVTDGRDTLTATVTATPPTFSSTLVVTDGRDTFGAAPTTTPPTFSSTLVATDGTDTFAASVTAGAPTFDSTLVVTDGRDTLAATVTATPPTHTSTLVVTDGRDTFAGAPTATPPTHTSTLVVTDGRDTLAATVTATPPTHTSTLVVTDGRDTFGAAPTTTPPTFTSTLVVTDGRDTLAATVSATPPAMAVGSSTVNHTWTPAAVGSNLAYLNYRNFNGTSNAMNTTAGSLAGVDLTTCTIAFCIRMNETGDDTSILRGFNANTSTGNIPFSLFSYSGASTLGYWNEHGTGNFVFDGPSLAPSAGVQIVVMAKNGTDPIEWSVYNYASPGWVHTVSTLTDGGNPVLPTGTGVFWQFGNGSVACDLVAGGLWGGVKLTTTQRQQLSIDFAAWAKLFPNNLELFRFDRTVPDDSVVGTSVPDVTAPSVLGPVGVDSPLLEGVMPSLGSSTAAWSVSSTAQGVAPIVGVKQGTALATHTWSAAATGSRVLRGTATATWVESVTAVGSRTLRGQATATWVESVVAAGRKVAQATATANWVETVVAAGKKVPWSSVTATHLWTATAAGVKPVVPAKIGSAVAVWVETVTAAGARASKGTVTAAHTWTLTASGFAPAVGVSQGSALAAHNWATTAAGSRTLRGSAVANWVETVTAAGRKLAKATVTATWVETVTATGKRVQSGQATATWVETVVAAGRKIAKGTTTVTWVETVVAAGKATPKATGTVTHTWTITAQGAAPVVGQKQGSALVAHLWQPSAVGKIIAKGTVTAAHLWATTAVGSRTLRGQAVANHLWTPTAAGVKPVVPAKSGSAVANHLWAPAAVGKRTPKATVVATHLWVVTAQGVKPALGVKQGSALVAHLWQPSAAGRKVAKSTAVVLHTWTSIGDGSLTPKGQTVTTWRYTMTAGGGTVVIIEGEWEGQFFTGLQYEDQPVVDWLLTPPLVVT